MSSSVDVPRSLSPPAGPWGLPRWVGTSNPFYVVSAGLFLVGLRASFGAQARDVDAPALMAGLAGYTLLLAATAVLLIRVVRVWDDARTVLLLVGLMFLATSVTFDELLAVDPGRGVWFSAAGLALAVGVTEGVLRAVRLRLPARFRGPLYLLLALFFLYPPALTPLLADPTGEPLLWGLWGFGPAAGLAALTLLPAARRGPAEVRGTGSPWPWPYYPWAAFVLLGLAVPARAFLLCWSFHLPGGSHADRLVFGPHFVAPFGLAVAAVLLEAGRTAGNRTAQRVALLLPAGLAVLAGVGHRDDPVYRQFLDVFAGRLGGSPLFLAVLAAGAFYMLAGARRVPGAAAGLTAVLIGLSAVGPETVALADAGLTRPVPLLLAGAVQMGLGLRRGSGWRCLAGGGLAAAAPLALADGADVPLLRAAVSFHLALATALLVGATFAGPAGRAARAAGVLLALAGCLAAGRADVPAWAAAAYPAAVAAGLAGYGVWLRYRPAVAAAGLALAGWLGVAGWRGYRAVRDEVPGLDYLALSLGVFAVAVLVSLGKAGRGAEPGSDVGGG